MTYRLRVIAVLAALLLAPLAARAQSQSVVQSGAITIGHVPYWVYAGVLGDGGPATNGNISEIGITKNGGAAFGIQDTNAHTGPYRQMTFGIDSTKAFIDVEPYGGATAIPFDIIVNGSTISIGPSTSAWLSAILDQQFGSTEGMILYRGASAWAALAPQPSGFLATQGSALPPAWAPGTSLTSIAANSVLANFTSGSAIPAANAVPSCNAALRYVSGSGFACPSIRTIASGASDTATSSDSTVAWNSATASSKTETIPACNSGNNGLLLRIKDERGTAATYPIAVTPASGTIDGNASYLMTFNLQGITLQCDGTASNWILL